MITVEPGYVSVEAVRDIVKPWIVLWGGDEWGESMMDLLGAAKTCYGFSDEDCALFATKLLENLIWLKEDMVDSQGEPMWGYGWGRGGQEALDATRLEARKMRDHWLEGGNLNDWRSAAEGKKIIDQLPDWLFEPEVD